MLGIFLILIGMVLCYYALKGLYFYWDPYGEYENVRTVTKNKEESEMKKEDKPEDILFDKSYPERYSLGEDNCDAIEVKYLHYTDSDFKRGHLVSPEDCLSVIKIEIPNSVLLDIRSKYQMITKSNVEDIWIIVMTAAANLGFRFRQNNTDKDVEIEGIYRGSVTIRKTIDCSSINITFKRKNSLIKERL